MPNAVPGTHPHAWISLLLLTLATVHPLGADEPSGMSHDDPKAFAPPLLAYSQSASQDAATAFLTLPHWARSATMPPLPQAVQPTDTKVVVLTTLPIAAHKPLAPPMDAPQGLIEKLKTPAAVLAPSSDLVAVSPFLQGVKPSPSGASARGAGGTTAADANPGPYRLPTLINSPDFGTKTTTTGSDAPAPTTGASATYSTSQR